MSRFLAILSALLLCPSPRASADDVDGKIDAILARLSLREKLAQLWLVDGHDFGGWKPEHLELARQGAIGGTFNVRGDEYTRPMQEAALSSGPGIPLIFSFDVLHGYRTVFPIPLAEAASWNPELAERCSAVAAKESRSANVSWVFAPVADIARDPRWGRVVEGAGEDPVLCAAFTRARVQGLQGEDISAPDRVAACLKHFAGCGAAEGGRDYNLASLSVRELRQTYFPPFKAGIEAGARTVMPAFSSIDGIPATCSPWLLNGVLRDEWGFSGLVVSDYDSVGQLLNHRVAGSYRDAALGSLRAGLDVELWGRCFNELNHGPLSKSDLQRVDQALRRLLRLKFDLGIFDRPFGDPALEAATLLAPDHLRLAREAATEACVLLKNEGSTLPIPPEARKIAVIGPFANDRKSQLGSWWGDGKEDDVVTIADAIRERLGDQGEIITADGAPAKSTGFSFAKPTDGSEAAKDADFIVVVVGEHAEKTGEAASSASLDLPTAQMEIVRQVAELGKPYAVVLSTGRPLTVTWIAEHAPAVLLAWQGGTMGGPAVADLLFGDANPSGKLPLTFPRSVGQIPINYNATPTSRPLDEANKWTSRYQDIPSSPLWPFGHGLSYTYFSVSAPLLSKTRFQPDEKIPFQVTVRNEGNRDGAEVVQIYLRDAVATVTRPNLELKAFRKVRLAAGEAKTIDFTLDPDDLGFWMPDGSFRVEPGQFVLMSGNSSANLAESHFTVR